MNPLPTTRGCYVCGTDNPFGLKLSFEAHPEGVETRFSFRPESCGFRGVVHGGLIATVLDEVMVWAASAETKRFAYCAEMTIRYLRPTRPLVEVVATGQLMENRRGKLYLATGELRDLEGNLLAESNGKYLPVPAEVQAEVIAEFSGPLPGF